MIGRYGWRRGDRHSVLACRSGWRIRGFGIVLEVCADAVDACFSVGAGVDVDDGLEVVEVFVHVFLGLFYVAFFSSPPLLPKEFRRICGDTPHPAKGQLPLGTLLFHMMSSSLNFSISVEL